MIGNISSKVRYAILSTTPVVSGYAIPFKYWERAQIQAKIVSSAGVETTVSSSEYTVTSPSDSGTLTFVGGYEFPDDAVGLTLFRTLDFEQQTDFRNGDILDAEVLERVVDATVAQIQQLDERIKRALVIPLTDPDATLEIPSSQVRGNMLLGFDSTGELITILTTDIDQKLVQALAAEDSVLSMFSDPGMVIVRSDLAQGVDSKIAKAADNKANIDIVALAITNVNAVGNNIANVNAVAANAVNINAVKTNEANINAVNANKANIDKTAGVRDQIITLAGIELKIVAVDANKTNIDAVATDLLLGGGSNIKIVANDKANIDAVAGNKTNIDAVAGNSTNINAVAGNKPNIDSVGNNIANVNAVAANAVNINAVKTNEANINAVNANKANIDKTAGVRDQIITLAGIELKIVAVDTNKTNIDTVATDLLLGAASKVKIVAEDKTNIDAVAANKTNIDAVAGNKTNIDAVVANSSNINTVAANIAALNSIASNLAGILAASGHATNSFAYMNAAETARDKAQKWAEEAEDTPVEVGSFSALHHAAKAKIYMQGAQAADASANKQIVIDGVLYQYGLTVVSGHLSFNLTEVL